MLAKSPQFPEAVLGNEFDGELLWTPQSCLLALAARWVLGGVAGQEGTRQLDLRGRKCHSPESPWLGHKAADVVFRETRPYCAP